MALSGGLLGGRARVTWRRRVMRARRLGIWGHLGWVFVRWAERVMVVLVIYRRPVIGVRV